MPPFPLSYIFPPPPLCSFLVFFSSFIVLLSGPLERNSQVDGELYYLCYLRMRCIQALNELPLWLHRPRNSGKYSPVVFPQDLWYFCPLYPHNAFVEFPKWMKSRFTGTLLRSETQIFLITAWLHYVTV